ncbi:MAG: hypothetical protein WBX25_11660 [Rhodomicrobium sp.]
MVVTVIVMWMVKTAIHEVVRVIAVRYCFMTAAGAMLVSVAVEFARAAIGILIADLNFMIFLVPAPVGVDEVAVLEVINVIAVAHGGVTTIWTMLMSIGVVHRSLPYLYYRLHQIFSCTVKLTIQIRTV